MIFGCWWTLEARNYSEHDLHFLPHLSLMKNFLKEAQQDLRDKRWAVSYRWWAMMSSPLVASINQTGLVSGGNSWWYHWWRAKNATCIETTPIRCGWLIEQVAGSTVWCLIPFFRWLSDIYLGRPGIGMCIIISSLLDAWGYRGFIWLSSLNMIRIVKY